MLKTLAAVAALALVPTIASASTVMSFECEVTRVTPPEKNDYNPVVNTTLSTVYVGNRLTGFAVEHVETLTILNQRLHEDTYSHGISSVHEMLRVFAG